MRQCSATHILTRLVEHATLSESHALTPEHALKPEITLATYTCIVACQNMSHYFTYDPLRRACQNYVACMDALTVAFYMGMSESIRTACATISDLRTRFT